MHTYSVLQSGLWSMCCTSDACNRQRIRFARATLRDKPLWPRGRSPDQRLRSQAPKVYQTQPLAVAATLGDNLRYRLTDCCISAIFAIGCVLGCQSLSLAAYVRTYLSQLPRLHAQVLKTYQTKPLAATATLGGNLSYRLPDCCNSAIFATSVYMYNC